MAELLDRGGAELRRGGARRGCALGFVVAARGMDGMRGSAGRFKGASAGISACVPAVSASGIAGGGVAVAREESGRWGMTGGPGLSAKGGTSALWARGERAAVGAGVLGPGGRDGPHAGRS